MTNTCINLSSKILDLQRAPIRLQDIPRKTLRMYGIIFDDDDDSEDEEGGVLVIDETAQKTQAPNPSPAVPMLKTLYKPKSIIVENYCTLCNCFIKDDRQHRLEHCSQQGCPEWIPNPVAMAYHQRNHSNHPTKPFACQWCKKRYRFHLNMVKHYKICKSYKKSQSKAPPST